MPRKKLIRTNLLPYHVTARVNNRDVFPLEMSRMWRIFDLECSVLTQVYAAEIQSFVLMPNHFHLILTVPEHDLGIVMNSFISSVTRTTNLYSGRSGHLFGGPYFWSVIESTRYFGHAFKYVYRNPVRGGLCGLVEEYPYSTLYGLLGLAHLPFPIFQTRMPMELALPSIEPAEYLAWLNRPFPSEAETLIRNGLRRRQFGRILERKTRTSHPLLAELI